MSEKILIIDDDKYLRSELVSFLHEYDVLEAAGGEDALKLLKKANEIDLIILDLVMPGMDGLNILTKIKREFPDLKIIILTGHSSKEVVIKSLKGRADDFLEKPLDIKSLKTSIEKLLNKKYGEDDMNELDIRGKVKKVKRFLERNCFNKVSLKEASQVVCLSPKYLSRIFKKYANSGFSDFKLKIKINHAKVLLKQGGYNVNQISDKLGYENTESFIRQFKKLTGRTPTEFRKRK